MGWVAVRPDTWRVTLNWRWRAKNNVGGTWTYWYGKFSSPPDAAAQNDLATFLGDLYGRVSVFSPYQIKYQRSFRFVPPPDPSTHEDANTLMAAIFVFHVSEADGAPPNTYMSIPVPAPKPAIFQAAQPNLIDTTHTDVQGFANYVIANLGDRYGFELDAFVGGYRGILKWEHQTK